MMTENRAVVISVDMGIEKEGKKGPYVVTELTYKDSKQGKTFTKNIFENEDEPSALLKEVQKLKKGDNIKVTQAKNEAGYWNITGVEKVGKEEAERPASKSNTFKHTGQKQHSFADNALGQQVGNALTNATTLIANQCSEVDGMSLLEATRHIIRVGEQIKDEIHKGTINATEVKKATKKVESKKKVVVEDDDEELEAVEDDEEIDY